MRAVVALLLLAVALAGCGNGPTRLEVNGSPAPVSLYGCQDVLATPRPDRVEPVRTTTLCLINAERTQRLLQPLSSESRLQRAAELHSADMARRHFVGHRNPDGVMPNTRIYRQGYPEVLVGENLGWGVPRLASPFRMVQAWMHSPGHRANILRPGFREIGIGFADGASRPGPAPKQGFFYAMEFGGGS